MFDTYLHISGAFVGERKNIGHCDLFLMLKAMVRGGFRRTEYNKDGGFGFSTLTYQNADGWSADLLLKVTN